MARMRSRESFTVPDGAPVKEMHVWKSDPRLAAPAALVTRPWGHGDGPSDLCRRQQGRAIRTVLLMMTKVSP